MASRRAGLLRRWAWFVALWVAGVLAVLLAAGLLRIVIRAVFSGSA